MGIFSKIFSKNKESLAGQLIRKSGYEEASIFLYGMVSQRFNIDEPDEVWHGQMEQFVREEFDAASQGSAYSKKFVDDTCPDASWYKGAMGEDAKYPIDGKGGPQQTLLDIILPLIREDDFLAIKLRCDIVKMIYEDLEVLRSEYAEMPLSALTIINFKKRRAQLAAIVKKINSLYHSKP